MRPQPLEIMNSQLIIYTVNTDNGIEEVSYRVGEGTGIYAKLDRLFGNSNWSIINSTEEILEL